MKKCFECQNVKARVKEVIVIMSNVGCSAEIQYRTISVENHEDKVAGGWLAQATGVLWAQYTEGK